MTEINHAERSHFLNGGSVIGRRKACPGSLMMEKDEPDQETEASKQGTAVHECIELLVPHAISRWNKENLWWGAPKLAAYDDEQIEAGKLAAQDILSILGPLAPHVAYVQEHRFIIDAELELGGSVDFAWGYERQGKRFGGVWDYKNGVTPVDARKTLQTPQYAAGLQVTIGRKKPFEFVDTHIFQPNSDDPATIRTHLNLSKEDLERVVAEQIEIAKTALGHYGEDKLTLAVGDHCFFCKAKVKCPAYKNKARLEAEKVLALSEIPNPKNESFETIELIPGMIQDSTEVVPYVEDLKVVEMEQLTPPQLLAILPDDDIRDFYLTFNYLKPLIKATEEYIKQRCLTTGFPGVRAVEGSSRRCWPEGKDIREVAKQLKEIGIEKPFKKQLIGIGEAESALMDTGLKKKEAAAKLEGIVGRGLAPVTLVLEASNDKRPSIINSQAKKATDVFDEHISVEVI